MKVIVLPGLGGTGSLLKSFCDALPAEYAARELSYDDGLTAYDDVVAHVQAQLPGEDHVIVAESFSGPVAITLAAQGIPGLRGIVCVATFARRPRYIPQVAVSLARFVPLTSRLFVFLGMPFLMGRWGTPAFRKEFAALLAPIPKTILLGRIRAVAEVNVTDALDRVRVPVLYLQASRDRLVPRKAGRDFADVQVVDGPHFLLQANPADAATAVAAFLQQLTAPTGP